MKKIFKTHLSKYLVLFWTIVSIFSITVAIVVFIRAYNSFIQNTKSTISTIAQQSAFEIQTYVRLLHASENSFKDSLESNFYSTKLHSIVKDYVDINPDIYAVLIISHDNQIIDAYPKNATYALIRHSVCSPHKPTISTAFYLNKTLAVADCVPFSQGYIVVARVPILTLVKHLINIDYKSLNIVILNKNGQLQDSLKDVAIDNFKAYLKHATKQKCEFTTNNELVSYAKIPYTGRILFVSVSKQEVYKHYLKTALPFLYIMFFIFLTLSAIYVWFFYRLKYFEKIRHLNALFVKTSNDINAILIDKISFRALLDKISQKFIENEYIELCIFYFKEKNEIKLKSYKAKEECLQCFNKNAFCGEDFSNLARNTTQALYVDVAKVASLSKLYKFCSLRYIGVFPINYDSNTIGSLIIASKSPLMLQSDATLEIIVHIVNNIENKLKLSRLEALQASSKNKAQYLAYHDQLTGLANRSFFTERFTQALAKTSRSKANIALFSMDLDGFKFVNDTFGHDMGDKLLKSVSLRLKSIVRTEDTLCRFGGDEFLILTDSFDSVEDLEQLAKRILKSINEPFTIQGKIINVGISIGIAYAIAGCSASQEDFLKAADEMLYKSKNTGRNKYSITELC